MKNKLPATLALPATLMTAAIALGLSTTASFAGYFLPGETMGVSLNSPLPEGVFLADLESYGRADKVRNVPDAHVGVNIPLIIWSTPLTFYNNRIEVLAAFPFQHFDARTGVPLLDNNLNFAGAATFALGPILAHDFGNGLTGGLAAFVRTPSPSHANIADGQTVAEADFRQSLQYVFGPGSGVFSGISIIENAGVTSALGQRLYRGPQVGPLTVIGGNTAQNDMFAADFAIEKTFGKLTLGITGYGNVDLDNRGGIRPVLAGGGTFKTTRQASAALGGLVSYNFGPVLLTGIVTRTVYENAAGISGGVSGIVSGTGYETRGWVRAVVPLYVAPPPTAPVVARY